MKTASHANQSIAAKQGRKPALLFLSAVLAASFVTGSAVAQSPAPGLAITSAPQSATALPTPSPTNAVPGSQSSNPGGGSQAVQLQGGGLQQAGQPQGAPWVLSPEQHPSPLFYREPQPLTSLILDLPSEADARIMLPGRAADAADQARFAVSRYLTNVIGQAAQARGAQLEAVNAWVEKTRSREALLSQDPWVRYQFSLEARAQLESFRASLSTQSTTQINTLANTLREAVDKVSPLLSAMPTYETRLAWYNILVQLKEGMGLFQAQVTNSDKTTLGVIDQYLAAHPAVARPVGDPPLKQEGVTPAKEYKPAATNFDVKPAPRVPTKPLDEEPQDTTGGLIVAFGIVASIIGFFVYLRKRNKASPGAKV